MSKNNYKGVDSYANSFIIYKAKALTRLPFFLPDDFQDLQQELMIAYLHAWPNFDPDKGHKDSFIKAVVNNRASEIIRDVETQKRWSGFKNISLANATGNEEGISELIDLIPNEQSIWGEQFSSDSYLFADEKIDIQRLLKDMPSELLQTYKLIMKHEKVQEAAEAIGVPRTTFSTRLKALRNYLKIKML